MITYQVHLEASSENQCSFLYHILYHAHVFSVLQLLLQQRGNADLKYKNQKLFLAIIKTKIFKTFIKL